MAQVAGPKVQLWQIVPIPQLSIPGSWPLFLHACCPLPWLRRLLHFHTAYHQDSCELNFKNNNKNSKSPCLPPNEDLEGQQSEVEESFLSLKRGSGSSCTHRVEPISLKHVMGVDCTERKHPTASWAKSPSSSMLGLRASWIEGIWGTSGAAHLSSIY